MTNEQFAALVAELEQAAIRNPEQYRLKVLGLAILGNAYLIFVLMLITALFLASLASVVFLKAAALKIIVPIGIILWAVLKSLWVKVPDPQGIKVTRREAPELFQLIDAQRMSTRAPRFHSVLITDDFNAAVAQRPRMGMFGGYRNFLLLGLPLMKMLSVEQFTAVLAHEFGPLAKGHGRLSNGAIMCRSAVRQPGGAAPAVLSGPCQRFCGSQHEHLGGQAHRGVATPDRAAQPAVLRGGVTRDP